MKKTIGLILICILAFVSYQYFITEESLEKSSQPVVIDNKINEKIDYSQLKLDKKLVTELPLKIDYNKKSYGEVHPLKQVEEEQKEEDFSINSNIDINKDEKTLDGAKIEIIKKF